MLGQGGARRVSAPSWPAPRGASAQVDCGPCARGGRLRKMRIGSFAPRAACARFPSCLLACPASPLRFFCLTVVMRPLRPGLRAKSCLTVVVPSSILYCCMLLGLCVCVQLRAKVLPHSGDAAPCSVWWCGPLCRLCVPSVRYSCFTVVMRSMRPVLRAKSCLTIVMRPVVPSCCDSRGATLVR